MAVNFTRVAADYNHRFFKTMSGECHDRSVVDVRLSHISAAPEALACVWLCPMQRPIPGQADALKTAKSAEWPQGSEFGS
jgi:hypothetical protein